MLHQKTFTKKHLIFFVFKFKISTFRTSFTKSKTSRNDKWKQWSHSSQEIISFTALYIFLFEYLSKCLHNLVDYVLFKCLTGNWKNPYFLCRVPPWLFFFFFFHLLFLWDSPLIHWIQKVGIPVKHLGPCFLTTSVQNKYF